MSLPSMSGVGRLTQDVELRFSGSGVAVATLNLAFNARRKNQQTGEWEDGDVFFVRATAFKALAEHAAESLARGSEVVVAGRLKTEQWQDRQSGEKRSATALLLDAIGPDLSRATAQVQKVSRDGGGGSPAHGRSGTSGGEDPWGSAPASGPAQDDESPF